MKTTKTTTTKTTTKTTKTATNALPALYSRNSDGSIQIWDIAVQDCQIIKTYGVLDGKMQTSFDTIAQGKNLGKANETTAAQQAVLEALAQWEKKLKSGYVRDVVSARAGAVDAGFVTGGIEPMLAHKFADHAAKISYPAYVQPKLDGIRCIAVVADGVCRLWTRTRKPITGVPHIIAAIERWAAVRRRNVWGTVIFDGELYNHAYKNNFEQIVSYVRQVKPKPGHEVVQYHVYDIADTSTNADFAARTGKLSGANIGVEPSLVTVQTDEVHDDAELLDAFNAFRAAGYEGAMVRNAAGAYENKRSYNLQKIKEMDDAEFEVVDVERGRGRMSDCGIFVCKTKDNTEFSCKMEGSLEALKQYVENKNLAVGKLLTVRYQGLTNGGVPRFPIGVTLRDYE